MAIRITALENYQPEAHRDRGRQRRFLFGWLLSFVFYVSLLSFTIYQGVTGQFEAIQFVDEEAERLYSVTWLTKSKPLHYPPGFFAPQRTQSLDALEREQEEEERRQRARERRRALAEARKRAAEKAAEKQAAKPDEAEKTETAANNETPADAASSTEPEKPAEPNKMPAVAINTYPLRQHINEAVDRYRKGQFGLNLNALSGAIEIKLDKNGEFEEVRMARSSGSRDADNMAVALLKELLAQPGMKPFLQKFVSIRIDVAVTAADVLLTATGDTGSGVDAGAMTALLKLVVAQGKLRVAAESNTARVLNYLQLEQDGTKIKVRVNMPRGVAGEVMKGFGTVPEQTT